jgi:hypothetical protein
VINLDVIYLIEVERRKDEIAQAEQYRLIRQLPKRISPLRELYQRSLARLGDLMVAWGSQLQARFATESSTRLGTTSENSLSACH